MNVAQIFVVVATIVQNIGSINKQHNLGSHKTNNKNWLFGSQTEAFIWENGNCFMLMVCLLNG